MGDALKPVMLLPVVMNRERGTQHARNKATNLNRPRRKFDRVEGPTDREPDFISRLSSTGRTQLDPTTTPFADPTGDRLCSASNCHGGAVERSLELEPPLDDSARPADAF